MFKYCIRWFLGEYTVLDQDAGLVSSPQDAISTCHCLPNTGYMSTMAGTNFRLGYLENQYSGFKVTQYIPYFYCQIPPTISAWWQATRLSSVTWKNLISALNKQCVLWTVRSVLRRTWLVMCPLCRVNRYLWHKNDVSINHAHRLSVVLIVVFPFFF